MKGKRNYLRYLLSVMLLVAGLLFEGGVHASAAYPQAGRGSAQLVSKKKNKKKKKNNSNNQENNKDTNQKDNSKSGNSAGKETEEATTEEALEIDEDGEYTSKEEVALYLHTFGHLPDNYITKKEARELGWVSSEGNLWKVAPGKSIGGDYFGNYEEILPVVKGRSYYECDIDTDGHYRGAKRIIFSNDGWIYYTEDHYETFEELFAGDEK